MDQAQVLLQSHHRSSVFQTGGEEFFLLTDFDPAARHLHLSEKATEITGALSLLLVGS